MTHDEIRSSLPAFALGALDNEEARAVAAHLPTCDECSAELASLGRVVEAVALASPPVTPPPALRGRVLDRIATERQQPSVAPFQPKTNAARPPRRGWLYGLALAASVMIAVGASFYAWTLRAEVSALREAMNVTSNEATKLRAEVATLRRNWVEVTRVINVLRAPDMLKVDLAGQPGAGAPGATGRAFWSRRAGLTFTAEGLPALPKGKVYQLWTITGTVATGAGLFTPDAAGGASVTSVIAADAKPPNAFGVTIEPSGGSATPTMPIVLIGTAK